MKIIKNDYSLLIVIFSAIILSICSVFFTNSEFAKAAPVSIDCSSGSPRSIAQGTDFASADDLTLTGAGTCVLTNTATLSSLVIGTVGGDATILTHQDNTTSKTYTLDITTTGNITIYSGASINVTDKGYEEDYGTGKSLAFPSGGGYGGAGGSYPGYGAGGITYGSVTQPNDLGSGGSTVGQVTDNPDGGGAVKLIASGTITVDGTIITTSTDSCSNTGGGSGGSIWLNTNILDGDGELSADGGNADCSQDVGGGGGGRIAVYYNTDNSTLISDNTKIHAYGGLGWTDCSSTGGCIGGAGTIFLDDKDDSNTNGDLIVDNNNASGFLQTTDQIASSSETYDNITIKNGVRYVFPSTSTLSVATGGSITGGGTVQPSLTIDGGIFYPIHTVGAYTLNGLDIILQNGGSISDWTNLTLTDSTFTHTDGWFGSNLQTLTLGSTGTFIFETTNTLIIGTLTVQSGGTFEQRMLGAVDITTVSVQSGGALTHTANSTSKLYELNIAGTTINIQGSVDIDGKGYENYQGPGKTEGFPSGAGYGGAGGDYPGYAVGGSTYGSATEPTDLGSGGGNSGGGGYGGGAVKLTVSGTLTIGGTITSDGTDSCSNTGGGSGGSILLNTNILAGSGDVGADGGPGSCGQDVASGGGGRVAIYYNTDNSTVTTHAVGGDSGTCTGACTGEDGTVNSLLKQPLTTNFPTGNGTTDFSALSDFTAISSMKLANTSGSITWTGADVNAEGENYDSYLNIGTGYVSMNVSSLDDTATNDSGIVSGFVARVAIGVDGCDTYTIYYADGFYNSLDDIKTNGQICNAGTTPACTSISCSGGTLSFDVPHFDGYGGEGETSAEEISTSVGVSNASPVFTAPPADGSSDATNPTNMGVAVNFSATAKDINEDQYFLAICKTDEVSSGGASAPSCDGGTWAISTEEDTDVLATVSYTALEVNPESNDWYAFACDKVAGGSCFPANGAGDKGFASGTITISTAPSDADYITVDSVVYEFNASGGDCTGGVAEDVCVTFTERDGQNTIAALVSAESGSNTHMTDRANVAYIYANNEGVAGNSIAIDVSNCSNCTAPNATLTEGSDATASPFKVNHAGTFGTVTVTDDNDLSIEPGDTLKFALPPSQLTDSDTDGSQDTLTMHICTDSTTAFNYSSNSCTDGTLICSSGPSDPSGDTADCTGGASLIPIPTPHGSYNFKVYVKDNHNFPATGTEQQSYAVTDVAPVIIGYTVTDSPFPSAGGNDTVDFSLLIHDDNGDDDVTGVEAYLYDSAAATLTTGACLEDENECYKDDTCTLSDVDAGVDNELTASCQVTMYFNANASSSWKAHANLFDELNTVTDSSDSDSITNLALLGIDIVQSGITYGAIEIGGTSVGQETSMGNVGNQILDVYLEGDSMCTDFPGCSSGNTISYEQQKWHYSDSGFDWDSEGYVLADTALGTTEATGCLDNSITVRTDYSSTSETNESIFWKLRIPASQKTGSYTGQVTFSTAAGTTCD